MGAPGNRVNEFSILIEDFDFQIAEDVATLLVIGNLGAGRAWTAGESLVAFGPASARDEILNHRPAGNQRRFFPHQVRSEGSQRGNVVDDPDATAVSGQHQIGFARVHCDVIDGHGRKIGALVLRPALTAVNGNP